MTPATTPDNAVTAVLELVLCSAFELGASRWKLAFSTGLGQPRHREVAARDLGIENIIVGSASIEASRHGKRSSLAPLSGLDSLYHTTKSARMRTRAQIILLAAEQRMVAAQIASLVRTGEQTLHR